MSVPRYPLAEWRGDATTYGPLPDAGYGWEDVRLIWHTTETSGLPSYSNGDVAPHFTFDPAGMRWIQHADLDRRVGTMRGYSSTGVRANEISVQIEIICYSDKSIADGSPSRLWVGDLTDEQYQSMADFALWLRANLPIGDLTETYGPSRDFKSFLYGSSASTRMSTGDWYAFGGGQSSHGSAPNQTHWNTGEMNLQKIVEMMEGESMANGRHGVDFCEKGDGFQSGDRPEMAMTVKYWQRLLSRLGTYDGAIDGKYGDAMAEAVRISAKSNSGDKIGNAQAYRLHRELIRFEIDKKLVDAGLVNHKHYSGTLKVDSLDEKTIKGQTGLVVPGSVSSEEGE